MIRDATDCWRVLDSERWQRMSAIGRRFVGWHNLEVFAITPCERDMFYQTVQDVWCVYESARALRISTPDVFSHTIDKVQAGTGLYQNLSQKVAKVEYDTTSLDAFL